MSVSDETLVYAVDEVGEALANARQDAPHLHPSRAVNDGVDPFTGRTLYRVHFIESDPEYDPDDPGRAVDW